MKRGHPVALRRVHIGSLQQERADGLRIATHGGVGEARW
jgi:hypothetical protein